MVEVISEDSHLVLSIRVSFAAHPLCLMGWELRPLPFMVLLYPMNASVD